jgi:hypothetical protein
MTPVPYSAHVERRQIDVGYTYQWEEMASMANLTGAQYLQQRRYLATGCRLPDEKETIRKPSSPLRIAATPRPSHYNLNRNEEPALGLKCHPGRAPSTTCSSTTSSQDIYARCMQIHPRFSRVGLCNGWLRSQSILLERRLHLGWWRSQWEQSAVSLALTSFLGVYYFVIAERLSSIVATISHYLVFWFVCTRDGRASIWSSDNCEQGNPGWAF